MRWFSFKRPTKVLEPLEGYNRWASTYEQEANPIKKLSDKFVESHLVGLKDKSVLDVGCGAGKFCSFAEKQEAKKVEGIDLSPEMVSIAKKKCQKTLFKTGDIAQIELKKNEFDVAICSLVLAHQKELEPSLSKLITCLNESGKLYITDFHPYLTMMRAKRTFKYSDNKTYEIEHHLHHFSEYFKCIEEQGARIKILEEPQYNESPVIFGMVVTKK
jgi:ubiquinone/menaquinone biosynthesis C-methylase UbiE